MFKIANCFKRGKKIVYFLKMSRIQLPYGVFEDNKPKIKLNLPRNYKAGEYFKKLLYLNDINYPAFQNSVVDVFNSRDNLCKFLAKTSRKT